MSQKIYLENLKTDRCGGMSAQDLAKKYGKSVRTIHRDLKALGLAMGADRQDIDDNEVLKLWDEGYTIVEIARKFSASHDTITKRLKKQGIACGRTEGINRHFSRVNEERWPNIKADLDMGNRVSFLAAKYHMRPDGISRLMQEHNYMPPNRIDRLDLDTSLNNPQDGGFMAMKLLTNLNVLFETNKVIHFVSGDAIKLDIYIPCLKLGIEINPTGTHTYDDPEYGILDRSYHQKKALAAESASIGLLHLYDCDYQDPEKWAVIERQLTARLGNRIKIGARKCEVRPVSRKVSNEFLKQYHFQGTENGSVFRLGLFYNDILVALLCIGNSRYTNDQYEIIRYCTHPEYIVMGCFDKLFSHFQNMYDIHGRIVSYMDLNKRFSNENVYEKHGFVLEKITTPDYVWYKKYGLPILKRYETTKRQLIQQGFDPEKTEVEIMRERGYFRVFGAGSKRYVREI